MQPACHAKGARPHSRASHTCPALSARPPRAQSFQVDVFTSDLPGAATKAPVTLRMRGDKGTGELLPLDNNPSNFERARHDTFEVADPPLGPLREIDIGHEMPGADFAWHLDRVEITPEGAKKPYVFHAGEGGAPGGQWFSSDPAVGGKTRRLLPVANGDLQLVKYQVVVQTGSHKYAGTEASVRMTIYGADKGGQPTKSRDDMRLENAKDNFAKGKLDRFILPPMADLGDIKRIQMGHDNSGAAAGWLLDYVEISIVGDAKSPVWHFPSGKWFDLKEEPKKTVQARDFVSAAANGGCSGRWTLRLFGSVATALLSRSPRFDCLMLLCSPPLQIIEAVAKPPSDGTKADYYVVVKTSTAKNAGTDAQVWVNVIGKRGETGKQSLANDRENFERGRTDNFTLKARAQGAAVASRLPVTELTSTAITAAPLHTLRDAPRSATPPLHTSRDASVLCHL